MPSAKRATRTTSTVLGKRAKGVDADDSLPSTANHILPTPESTPKAKRSRISVEEDSSRSNKENVPPLRVEALNASSGSPRTRTLSRTVTDTNLTRTPRSGLRRTATTSLQDTPSTALSGLTLDTPPDSPPSSLVPLHIRARGLLRATCNNTTSIAGRQRERDHITQFLGSFLGSSDATDLQSSTLYISGLPGTGKTALCNDILRTLDTDKHVIITVNCMALGNVDELWNRLQEDLGALKQTRNRGRAKKTEAMVTIRKLLADSAQKCIVILDELDHIAKDSASLTAFFSVVHEHRHNIRIIGIANTHTLGSSGSMFDGAAGVDTLHFSAYSGQQLLEIIQARFAPITENEEQAAALKKFMPLPALSLLTKKVAALTGDVRVVFEVLRGAIDKAVMASEVTDAPVVTPAHVLAAFKLYAPTSTAASVPNASNLPSVAVLTSDSQLASQVRGLGLQQRLVLLAIVLGTQRVQANLPLGMLRISALPSPKKSPVKRARSTGSSIPTNASNFLDGSAIHAFYSSILTRSEDVVFAPAARSEFADLLGMLETVGLVALSSSTVKPARQLTRAPSFMRSPSKSKAGSGAACTQDVKLAEGVRLDEVLRGLGCSSAGDEPPADTREEEVRAIYHREQARTARDIRNSITSGDAVDVFAEAEES